MAGKLGKYVTNVGPDYPDNRDWIYRPALVELDARMPYPSDLHIRNQGREGACTGFALAASIDLLKRRAGQYAFQASARMLYEMAKRHDEWAGEDYEGSSLRGVIHGWKHMGVCTEEEWKYTAGKKKRGDLTVERAEAARRNTIGAYYRLRPEIADFHAALKETGVILASARVHAGWQAPADGVIRLEAGDEGGHAFAIVGYDDTGFWIQNSWGTRWGDRGVAHWSYVDWITNLMDAWVFRLALPTPEIFGLRPMASKWIGHNDQAEAEGQRKPTVHRTTIAGHFVHIDDGRFAHPDRYWSTAHDVQTTADRVAPSTRYQHVVFYGHGGLNAPKDSARRIARMKDVFLDNGIYPYHFMYDTGLAEELKDVILGKSRTARTRTAGLSDWLDRTVEHLVRRPGTLLWEEMKEDADDAFDRDGAGTISLRIFFEALRRQTGQRRKKVHWIGHSTGAILFGHLLQAFNRSNITFETAALLAPACSVEFYQRHYLPILQGTRNLKIKQLDIYNLRDKLEQDDVVLSSTVYRKSLLYLVSNALEREPGRPLLGMEKFQDLVDLTPHGPAFHLSNGATSTRTRSTSHGGFDNDPTTMNNVLKTILGGTPTRTFTADDLDF